MAGMVVLKIEHAKKSFGDRPALIDVSLELREGELIGLLGPNGAGKTTLVRALAGRVRLDGGEIELFGERVAGASRRTGLGVVPQETAVYPLLNARENLEVFGRLNDLRGPRLRDRVRWALEWTGLADRAREPTKQFSGGMRRRLNIACGILHEPRVILLDEPTVGVDPQSRERIYDMLAELRAAGASLLLTTHQLEEAEARCERVVTSTTAASSPRARCPNWCARPWAWRAACGSSSTARRLARSRDSRPRPMTTASSTARCGTWTPT